VRFIENGPDIPDELLYAQDEGNVVFFCGAGVSRAYTSLPDFAGLAEQAIDDLGATEESKAKKLFAKYQKLNEDSDAKGLISADHIFSALIRSFDRQDINQSVATLLRPPKDVDLTAHKIILDLACLQSGHTRLVTTNFDLLFEQAGRKKIHSATRSNLPRIQYTDNNWGSVHLHGKVTEDYSDAAYDGFVISSSEFGDAYLAQGWAREFVKEVLKKFTAVFIGYSADDPPIRYLLEGLQEGEGDKNNIYAFQGSDEEAVAQWAEKGVKPIVFELDAKGIYAPLWDSLSAWGKRSKDPVKWKSQILSKAKKGPTKMLPHERGMITHLISSQSGARAFSQQTPPIPAEWLCVFDPAIRLQQVQQGDYWNYQDRTVINPYELYGIDKDPPPSDRNEEFSKEDITGAWDVFSINSSDVENLNGKHLSAFRNYRASEPSQLPERLSYIAYWISKVSNQRISVWWAGRQLALHPSIITNVERSIKYGDIECSDPIQWAWNAVFELSQFYEREEYQEHSLQILIKKQGWNDYIIREFGRLSKPYLKRDNIYARSIPRDNRKKLNKFSLIKPDVGYPEGAYSIIIPDEHLAKAINLFRENVEYAVDLEQSFSGWLKDLSSIEPDDDNISDSARRYGLSGYVLHLTDLFKQLLASDPDAARIEFKKWSANNPIFIRLRIWAWGLDNLINGEEFTNGILSLHDEDFWSSKGSRDFLISLKRKWPSISKEQQKLIEQRILKGPSKYKKERKLEYSERSAHIRLSRLHWLENNGCNLNLDLGKVTEKLKEKSPEWKSKYAKAAADGLNMRSGIVRTDTDWTVLSSLPLSEIINKAKNSRSRNFGEFIEYAPFSGLCDDKPLIAISALMLELKKGEFHSDLWETFLSRDSRKQDSYRMKILISGRITQFSNKNFKSLLLTASRWFEAQGPEIRSDNPKMFDAVWSKFIKTIKEHENSSGSALVRQENKETDWTGEAINSPSGNLASLHMTDPLADSLKDVKKLPKAWLSKAEDLLSLPNDAHRYVMVIFAYRLNWFYYFAPKWTEKAFLKLIENNNSSQDDVRAIWSGFMWGAKMPNSELFIKLKPYLLDMAKSNISERRRHTEVLSGLLLSGWASSQGNKKKRYVSNDELRSVLLNSGDNFRASILWHLQRWASDKESIWAKQTLEFFRDVWPKHKMVRTAKTSARLCEIALNQKYNFSQFCNLIIKLVAKVDDEFVHIPEIRKTAKDEEGSDLAEKHPEDYLNLLYAILPDQPEKWPYGSVDVLKKIEESEPSLLKNPKLIEIKSRLNEL
jgi:hypothetical protein